MSLYAVLAVILLAFCQIAGGILAGILVSRRIDRVRTEVRDEISRILVDWTSQPEEGKASKLAELVDMVGAVIGSAAARSILASLNADASHGARAANTLSDQITAQQNPLLGLLTGSKRGKGAAVARLAQLLGGMFTGSGSGTGPGGQLSFPAGNGGGDRSSVLDRIKKQGGM